MRKSQSPPKDLPPQMEDAGKTLVKTPTTARANKIRDREFSTHGDKTSGVERMGGTTEWSRRERDRLTGESLKSSTNK
jgi:hypothetical protein